MWPSAVTATFHLPNHWFMTDLNQSIFREKAVKRYLEAKDRAVLPPFVSRAIVVRLWALLGVLLACGAITSLAIIRFLAHE
jgi:hypothetical protein